jgi:hypothetical protein
MPSQIQKPDAGAGDAVSEGMSAIYGAMKYARGKRNSEQRKQRIRPNLALARGYRTNWRMIPTNPMMAIARPIVGGGKASPPANLKTLRWYFCCCFWLPVSGTNSREVDKNRIQRVEKAPM